MVLIPKMIMVTRTITVASSDHIPAPIPITYQFSNPYQIDKHWGAKIIAYKTGRVNLFINNLFFVGLFYLLIFGYNKHINQKGFYYVYIKYHFVNHCWPSNCWLCYVRSKN
jgi:hypothetical protein